MDVSVCDSVEVRPVVVSDDVVCVVLEEVLVVLGTAVEVEDKAIEVVKTRLLVFVGRSSGLLSASVFTAEIDALKVAVVDR